MFDLSARISSSGRGVSSRLGVILRRSETQFKKGSQASASRAERSEDFSRASLVGRAQEFPIKIEIFFSSSPMLLQVGFRESTNNST